MRTTIKAINERCVLICFESLSTSETFEFEILCGDMETAQKINNMLKPLEHKFNRVISIGITPSSEDE